ncbi:MAG: hypothetical protein KA586_08300 [Candidatus Promineofilum sp.]|nr:hypothetical protein [Promineifilum sp.]
MGFLKKLFGESERDRRPPKAAADTQGVYFYVQCDRCGTPVRLRADKQFDLINEGTGYVWHKTIIDSRCFQRMPTVVNLNSAYEMVSHEITGGHYITGDEYETLLAQQTAADRKTDETPSGS